MEKKEEYIESVHFSLRVGTKHDGESNEEKDPMEYRSKRKT